MRGAERSCRRLEGRRLFLGFWLRGYLGKVFYVCGDHVAREVASGIKFANGVGISPDGATLYVAETPTGKVLAFAIKAEGSWAARALSGFMTS